MDARPRGLRDKVEDETWMAEGACRGQDPALFFPVVSYITAEARQICAGCPVRERCLAYALRCDFRDGLWGGMDPSQRKRARKAMMGRGGA